MTASVNNMPGTFCKNSHETSISAGGYEIAVHQQLDATVRQQWLTLLANLKSPTLFQHIAWHEAFLTSRYDRAAQGQTLFVVVSRAGEIVALLPLSYRTSRRYGLPVRIVELLFPTDMGVRDLLVRDDIDGGAILTAVFKLALPRAGFSWDVAKLSDLTATSTAFRAFEQMPTRRKLAIYHHDSNRLKSVSERSQCFSTVSKSHIKKTKRKRKSLDALGKVECELITDPAAMPQALELFIELEDAGWKGSAGEKTSLRHDLPQKAFYEALIGNPGPALSCCMALMRLDGVPIAANLCTHTGDTLWMLKITYADQHHDYSPGNLLLMHLLEHFAEDNGIEYISFITGGEWTLRWRPEQVPVYHCETYGNTANGWIQCAITKAIDYARQIKHRRAAASTATPAAEAE